MTILVINDDMVILDNIGTELSEKGHKVLLAYDMDSAMENLRDNNVGLMIADINFPGKDGFKLLEYTRKIIKYRKLPIVLIEDESDQETIEKAKELEINVILPRPVDIEKLLPTVEGIQNRLKSEKDGTARRRIPVSNLTQLQILIVDDEIPITELLKEFLEPLFSKVYTAHGVQEALDVCEHNVVDVVISDIKMAGKSGFDLIEWINESPNTAGIPVIMITGVKKDIQSVQKAKNLWIDGYMIKPFELEKIKKALSDVCSNAYRLKKLKIFNKFFLELNEDAEKEEQNQMHQIRGQILGLKKELNVAIKELRLVPKEAPTKVKHDLEEKIENLEAKAKDFQDRMSLTKTEFFERRREFVALKRSLHQRMDKVR